MASGNQPIQRYREIERVRDQIEADDIPLPPSFASLPPHIQQMFRSLPPEIRSRFKTAIEGFDQTDTPAQGINEFLNRLAREDLPFYMQNLMYEIFKGYRRYIVDLIHSRGNQKPA